MGTLPAAGGHVKRTQAESGRGGLGAANQRLGPGYPSIRLGTGGSSKHGSYDNTGGRIVLPVVAVRSSRKTRLVYQVLELIPLQNPVGFRPVRIVCSP